MEQPVDCQDDAGILPVLARGRRAARRAAQHAYQPRASAMRVRSLVTTGAWPLPSSLASPC